MTWLWAIYILGLVHYVRCVPIRDPTHPQLMGRIGYDLGRTAALMCWPVPFVIGFWRGIKGRL